MATGLGSLIVTLEANMARFQSDLGRGVHMAETAMAKITAVTSAAGLAIESLGAGLTVAGVAAFARSMINAADQLAHLHVQTGLSVEALSAMDAEAAHVGLTLEETASAFDKSWRATERARAGVLRGGTRSG